MKFAALLNGIMYKMKKAGCEPAGVARRGFEPLISRMKTWRPDHLDERAKMRVQKYIFFLVLQCPC